MVLFTLGVLHPWSYGEYYILSITISSRDLTGTKIKAS